MKQKPMDQYTWQEVEIGGVLTEPGTARNYRVGEWRSMHPVWDTKRCIKCGVCWCVCPEGAIQEQPDGYFNMQDYCKGCGICTKECVTGCISMVPEEG